jgi:hypothetical protein
LQHDSREPTPIVKLCPKMSRTVSRTIMQCIEADPNRRPETAEAVLTLIRKAQGEGAKD